MKQQVGVAWAQNTKPCVGKKTL